jgi:hypothetical protein
MDINPILIHNLLFTQLVEYLTYKAVITTVLFCSNLKSGDLTADKPQPDMTNGAVKHKDF